MNLQYFVTTLPQITSRETLATQIKQVGAKFTTDDAIRAWCEHDALHYLSQQPFTIEGENCVTYLEKKFNRGWSSFGDKHNMHPSQECESGIITTELIDDTAQFIMELIY
jgi:hypothetical protein